MIMIMIMMSPHAIISTYGYVSRAGDESGQSILEKRSKVNSTLTRLTLTIIRRQALWSNQTSAHPRWKFS
jgi:hypothetical protein